MRLRSFRGMSPAVFASSAGGSYDADAEALFARMTTSPPDTTRKGHINDVFLGLKSASIYSSIDWLCLAGTDAQASSLNWVSGSKALSTSGSVSHTTDRGFSGDGSTGYLDTGEVPNAAGNVYTQNNMCIGVYCNLEGGTSGSQPHVGDTNSPSSRVLLQAGKTAADAYRANDATSSTIGSSSSVRTGYRVLVRNSSTTKEAYRNNVSLGTASVSSVGVSSANMLLLRQATSYSSDRIAAYHSGSALDSSQLTDLYNIITTYLTAIGAN